MGRTDRALTVLVVLALILVGVLAARPGQGLILVAETDRREYGPGVDVNIRIRLEAWGNIPTTISLNRFCSVSFQVEDLADVVVYRPRTGWCPMVIMTLTLNPGESVVWTFVWPQVDDAGQPVRAGTQYRIVGVIHASLPVPLGVASAAIHLA